jgi:hypothetical protein
MKDSNVYSFKGTKKLKPINLSTSVNMKPIKKDEPRAEEKKDTIQEKAES